MGYKNNIIIWEGREISLSKDDDEKTNKQNGNSNNTFFSNNEWKIWITLNDYYTFWQKYTFNYYLLKAYFFPLISA